MIAQDQTCVRRKNHVGRSLKWRDQFDNALTREDDVESVPLFGGQDPVGTVDVALHPRVDDIVDLKKFRRTHQVTCIRSHNKDDRILLERAVCATKRPSPPPNGVKIGSVYAAYDV